LHHLPVRRAFCQPGCLDLWQKHHEQPPGFHAPLTVPLSRQPAGKNTLTSASEASASQSETTKGMENAGKILPLKLTMRFYIAKEVGNLIVRHRRPTA